MVAIAVPEEELFTDAPSVMPAERGIDWPLLRPVMRAFPRLAVERDEEPRIEARFDEEPERWDGMA